MEGILESVFSWGSRNDRPSGFHLEGLGAVFFVNHRPTDDWALHRGGDVDGAYLKQIESELVNVVAEYGSTMRDVEKSESIVMKVDFGRWGRRNERPSGLLLQVKKETVDRYAAGSMSAEAFRNAVKISEL